MSVHAPHPRPLRLSSVLLAIGLAAGASCRGELGSNRVAGDVDSGADSAAGADPGGGADPAGAGDPAALGDGLVPGDDAGPCVPETDPAFCGRLGKSCDLVTGTDNCGTPRADVQCGTSCPTGMSCGGSGQENVCGGPVDLSILPADRRTSWIPGRMALGGIPARTTPCGPTIQAADFGNGTTDATAAIQTAIDNCTAGQVVQLSAGTFKVSEGGGYLLIDKGITLRGAGAGQTLLKKFDGAAPDSEACGPSPSPILIIGPARWANTELAETVDLAADGAKGAFSVELTDASAFLPGEYVLVDELSGADWRTDPLGRGQIWASEDFRVTWQRHNPGQGTDDPYPAAWSWFSRFDRPTAEVKQVDTVSGNTVSFTTPLHIDYRLSHVAQVSRFDLDGKGFVEDAGVEDLAVYGGDNGQIRFQWAAGSWARRIDNSVWHDEGFAVDTSFRVEIRESYVHDAAWAQPGGAGYALSLSAGSAELLFEDNISIKANKVMVARSSGAGSVIGYNYVDNGYINTNLHWVEVGVNGSHMVGPHHMLFEGNYGWNADSDKTHGNSIYHTFFRNHLSGQRRDFTDTGVGNGPARCIGAGTYSYWMSYVGNVLGRAGEMSGWSYDTTEPRIWMLGWDDWPPYPNDPQVAATAFRHGNYDYVTGSVAAWEAGVSHTLPASLYLTSRPAFFGTREWPWVDPTGTTKLFELPAQARYEAGTPIP